MTKVLPLCCFLSSLAPSASNMESGCSSMLLSNSTSSFLICPSRNRRIATHTKQMLSLPWIASSSSRMDIPMKVLPLPVGLSTRTLLSPCSIQHLMTWETIRLWYGRDSLVFMAISGLVVINSVLCYDGK